MEEAQKYQALKAQAEEKLQQASEEIAQEGPDRPSGAAGGPEEEADVCPFRQMAFSSFVFASLTILRKCL